MENYNFGFEENNDETSNKHGRGGKRKNATTPTDLFETKKRCSNDVSEFEVELVEQSKEGTAEKTDKGGAIRWNKPMTMLLLHTYQEIKQLFNDPSCTKHKIWNKVGTVFVENGYNVSGEQCRQKMEYMKKLYKETKDHNNKSGNNRQDFQYMNEMDQLFKDEVYITPASTASSVRGSSSESEDEYNTGATKKKKALKQTDLLQGFLEERKKSRKQKELQMRMKTEISNKMLSLLEQFVKK